MRYIGLLTGIGLLLAVTGTAGANTVTFQFDPDDLVIQASATPYPLADPLNRQQQSFPKMYRANDNTLYFGSFYHPGFSGTNADFFGFRSNNTISIPFFNMFIQSAADAQTDNWGQGKLLDQSGATASDIFSRITQDTAAPPPTATAASGWESYVLANPYGPSDPHGGYLVGWYNTDFATDRSNDLMGLGDTNVGNDHEPFTFTITLNETLQMGDTVRLWLGFYGLASPENPPASVGTDYYAWTGNYTTAPSGLSVTSINAYEGVLYGTVVPEPVTLAGLTLGIGCLARYVRKRRRA